MPIAPASQPRTWILKAIAGAIALLIFTFIVLNRSPNLLRPLGMQIRFGFAWIVPILSIVLFLTFQIPGWLGRIARLSVVLSIFALALAGMWASGRTQSTVLSGLIPLYDAQSYYGDAQKILAGGTVSEFSTARPLFPGFLAVLLRITNRNLMGAIAIFTAINGFACYFAGREIQRTHGTIPAVFLILFIFFYFRYRTVGTVMSENIGLPTGILGTLLIWRGISNKSRALVLFGIFIDTLALNIRPGPFFVLPFLLLWGAWFFRGTNAWFSGTFLILGLGAILAGFGINLGMIRLVGTPSGVPFSQFSMAFYGLVSGGNSFAYVFQVHPELLEMSNPDKTRQIYRLAFDLLRTDPTLIVRGALHNWTIFLSHSYNGMFSYFSGKNHFANLAAYWGICLFCVLGFIKWTRNPSNPFLSFVTVTALGVLLSAPFVPAADAYGLRLYAATIITMGMLPASGIAFALEKIKVGFIKAIPAPDTTGAQTIIWTSISMVFLIVVGPFLVRGSSAAPPFPPTSCQPEEASIVVWFDAGSSLQIISRDEILLDWVPRFHIGFFKRNAHGLPDTLLAEWLGTIEKPATIFYTLDHRSNKQVLVVAPTSSLPAPGTRIEMCGQWDTDPALKDYLLFTSKHAHVIPR